MDAAGLYYEEHGPADAPPLILSAGMGGSGEYWRPNLPALAEHHRVILYDHRGTGRSDRTVTPRIESIGDDIRLLMDALGIGKASILGHAIGGMGGLSMALDTPERVDRLVVVNGWGRLDRYTARCFAPMARVNMWMPSRSSCSRRNGSRTITRGWRKRRPIMSPASPSAWSRRASSRRCASS